MTYEELLEKAREIYESKDTPHFFKAWLLANIICPTNISMEDDVKRRSTDVFEYARRLDACNQYSRANIDKLIAWLEKQGKQRSTENVEKKFCEGDKVVSNQDGKIYIVGTEYYVTSNNICLHDTDGNHKWTNRDDLDKNYHLWTSEDAKKLDADKVIEWLKTHGNLMPVVTIRINDVIAKFKEDFGL